jgi:3-oxoacyl-[acyl-carrier protein] reductase
MALVEGKVALVTGGARGIGRAAAELLAAEGARVAVADVNLGGAEDVASGIEARGGQALPLATDVSQPHQIAPMFDAVLRRFGRLDILHNNAGIFAKAAVDEIEIAAWDQLMGINLRGSFLVAQHALRVMKARGGGRIINMGSMGGQVGGVVAGADYAASKAAIACLTKSMAKWGGPYGILVNTVCPGVIDTAMPAQFPPDRLAAMIEATPLRRMGTADEVAKVVLFLASDLSSFVTGAHIDVNGGIFTD